jgi:hypothetical protein
MADYVHAHRSDSPDQELLGMGEIRGRRAAATAERMLSRLAVASDNAANSLA